MAKKRQYDEYEDEWGYDEDYQDRKRFKNKPKRGKKKAWYDDVDSDDPDYGFRDDDF